MAETKVTAAELLSGNVSKMQGGDPDDWSAPGTTNYSVERTNIMLQEGSILSGANGAVTVTFPEAFANTPRVQLTLNSNQSGALIRKIAETPTGFTAIVEKPLLNIGLVFNGVAGATITWSAKGRRTA